MASETRMEDGTGLVSQPISEKTNQTNKTKPCVSTIVVKGAPRGEAHQGAGLAP